MNPPFVEGKLQFDFSSNWMALKWDEEAAYREGVCKLEATKAVDFVGLHIQTSTWLIEVKDFRGYYRENKRRVEGHELAVEVAEKVRDTVASIVWAVARQHRGEHLKQFAKPIFDGQERPRVVLWMEDDRTPSAPQASTYAAEIKRQLKWLNPRVLVTSMALSHELAVPDLRVTDVP